MQKVSSPLLRLLLVALLAMVAAFGVRADDGGKSFVLVLDPGHGGHDAGACGAFSKEKDINLSVALEVGRLVKANCPDIKVVYTRQRDVFIPLQRRADIANEQKADLFVSIHTNALPKGRLAYGAETYTLGMARAAANLEVAKRENSVITFEKNYKQTYQGFDPDKAESYIIFELLQDRYMKQSVELARCIQKQYVNEGRKNKGVHQAGFLVLRATSMPAVLTELGFISTPEEERYLNSKAGVRALARSIYNGIVEYRRLHGGSKAAVSPVLTPESADKADTADATPTASVSASSRTKAAVVPVDAGTTTAAATSAQPAKQAAETTAASSGAKTTSAEPTTAADDDGRPVFKVQILTADVKLKAADRRFKGLKDVDSYSENGLYKYTYGESRDYAEIRRVLKSVADKFPDAFIVAFAGGSRTNLSEAIKRSRQAR